MKRYILLSVVVLTVVLSAPPLRAISGAPLSGLTGLNNGSSGIDFVQWGAVDGTVASTTGTMALDEFLSFR